MPEQLVGIAGGLGWASEISILYEEDVLDAYICSASVERLVDSRLDARVPLGYVLACAAPSELGGA